MAAAKCSEIQHSRLFQTDVRQLAEGLGIAPSPNEYVELVGPDGARLDGRVTVKLIRIESANGS